VLRRWDPAWAEEAAAAVVESLAELKPFLPWAKDGYAVEDTHAFIRVSVDKWDAGEEFNYAIPTVPVEAAPSEQRSSGRSG